MFDVVIVGSGAAGVAAAYALRGRKVCIVDVGNAPPEPKWGSDSSFDDLRRNTEPYWKDVVGDSFEGLHNVDKNYVPPKLKAPLQRFITDGATALQGIESNSFGAVMSLAQGGLANGWGAQLYRYTDPDLEQFPVKKEDLEPFYNKLTAHIGISGTDDDLSEFYGSVDGLLPPLRLGALAEDLVGRYQVNKRHFNRRGIFLGRPRLAVLSQKLGNRGPCNYGGMEFYSPNLPYIYTPRVTLKELVTSGQVEYLPGYFTLSVEDDSTQASVVVKELSTGRIKRIAGKRVVLAAGTIGSAAIMLRTFKDTTAHLPLMENLPSYIPFINPRFIGQAHEKRAYYTHLNLCHVEKGNGKSEASGLVVGTFYSIHGMFNSEFIGDLPFGLASNIRTLRHILPSLLVLHLWHPGRQLPNNYVSLKTDGKVNINYADRPEGKIESRLIKAFRRIGYLSAPFLCKYPNPGASIHYAGTLPMRREPVGKYETHVDGRVNSMRNVYVVDGAVFPALPAKNLSFTIMANAMRVVDGMCWS